MENKDFSSGTKVSIKEKSEVPSWSEWDDDRGRISTSVKKNLQKKFFNKDSKLTAEVVYITSESEREKLRKQGRTKIRVRDSSGSTIVFIVETNSLKKM